MFPRVLIVLMLSLSLRAQNARPVAQPYQPNYAELQTYLSLAPEQLAQLKKLQQDRQLFSQAVYMQVTAKQKQLNDLLNSGSTDAMAIGQLNIEIQHLRSEAIAPTDEREKALAVLDEKQREKLATLQQALMVRQAADQAASLRLLDYPKTVAPARPTPQ